jgi:transposase
VIESLVLDLSLPSLLAVDVGVRTGLAVYRDDGRLIWYRSRNFGAAARLKRAIPALLHEAFDPTYVVLEGGGPLAEHWATAAERHGSHVRRLSAEEWRSMFLLSRDQRSGEQAKRMADGIARRVVEWSNAQRPVVRHDAAEAILIGLWGVIDVCWLPAVPNALGLSVLPKRKP